jgi:hypothetical protein
MHRRHQKAKGNSFTRCLCKFLSDDQGKPSLVCLAHDRIDGADDRDDVRDHTTFEDP